MRYGDKRMANPEEVKNVCEFSNSKSYDHRSVPKQ